MSPESQRIAIAEYCGYKLHERGITAPSGTFSPRYAMPVISLLPDYLNDLNEIHKAEKILNRSQWGDYCFWLTETIDISQPVPHASQTAEERFLTLHATASQKAEALLRTIGRWVG